MEKGWGKGSQVTALLECGGMWLSTVGYGVTWRINKLMIDSDGKRGGNYEFIDEDGDEEADVDVEPEHAPEPERARPKKESNFMEDDASPPPPKKASALAAVMPQANPMADLEVGDGDEDEHTAAPAEVPKKPVVKKKVVPKKTA
jgi:hypothetical protein